MINYATAIDKKGISHIVKDLSGNRMEAASEAIALCKAQGLQYQGTHTVKGSGRQNGTLTKDIKSKMGRKLFWQF
jgi:hypothetical protein